MTPETVSLNLTKDQLGLIINALGEVPAKISAGLIVHLSTIYQQTFNAQTQVEESVSDDEETTEE